MNLPYLGHISNCASRAGDLANHAKESSYGNVLVGWSPKDVPKI